MPTEEELPPSLAAAVGRLEELLHKFEQHPDAAVQQRAMELLQCVDIIHRSGLRRLAGVLRAAGTLPEALADPAVRLLFELYDLHEGGERARVEALLETVRPAIESHGGQLELLEAGAGAVKVRLSTTDARAAGSAASMREAVEQVLRAGIPDAAHVEVEASATHLPSDFVPLSSLQLIKRPRLVWQTVASVDEVPSGGVRGVEIEREWVLIAHVEGEFFAYQNACPGTPMPLHGARVEGGTLICPWHHCRFDLRGGRRLEGSGPGLGVMPIRVEAGEVRIGILEGATA